MIIFIDASGNENVIRNDNIAIDLFKKRINQRRNTSQN